MTERINDISIVVLQSAATEPTGEKLLGKFLGKADKKALIDRTDIAFIKRNRYKSQYSATLFSEIAEFSFFSV